VFLVSAAHVLRLTKDRRLYYYIDPNTTHSISGQLRISRHSNIDVAVVKLDRQPLPPYRAVDKVPMVESMLLSRALPRTGKHYMVSGFPASKNRANPSNLTVNARVYAYRTESIDGAAYSAAGIDPGLHIGLPLDLRAGFDPRGEPVAFPDPHGMSGSPVWLLYDDAETPRDMFQAVAVAVEYRKPQRLLVRPISGSSCKCYVMLPNHSLNRTARRCRLRAVRSRPVSLVRWADEMVIHSLE
jgi:hypothetical protein